MVITADERYEWAHHPVTEEFLTRLSDAREDTKEAWAKEAFIGTDLETTAIHNATALGGIRVLTDSIEFITGLKTREEI